MEERPWGNEYRTTMVCIDGYDRGAIRGRFYNPYLSEGVNFSSLVQLLTGMEDMLDNMKFPQSFTAARAFPEAQSAPTGAAAVGKGREGEVKTFAVRVLFRQNASWQGSVQCVESRKEATFRSTMELIFLMDSALRGQG